LIDPSTGRALSGEALEKAKQEDEGFFKKWPRCENKVRKAAKFCNKCGSPAPKGWWRCPHCNKVVGNDSTYCWNCNAQLQPESRVNIAGGIWNKDPIVFAQRFDIGDIKTMLKKDLQIQAGTMALLLDGGKYKGRLDAGQYDPDSLLRKINHFGTPPPRSVILLDAGDVILPVRVDTLRSSEGMELEFYGEIVLRFNPKGAQEFIENRMKDGRELSYESLSVLLQGELRHAVDAMCVTSTIDDLIRDPERRMRLQDEITETLKVTLSRSGIDLIHVSSAEFVGDEYEELLEKQGDNEQKRRAIEYEKQLRDLLSTESMDKFKSEMDLKQYQELLANEYHISGLQRDREEKILLEGWGRRDELDSQQHEFQVKLEGARQGMQLKTEQVHHDMDVESAQSLHKLKLDADQTDHDIAQSEKKSDFSRTKTVKDAEAEAVARAATFEQEAAETDRALKWKREKEDIRADSKEREAKRRQGLDELTLLADIEDSQQRNDLMELMKLKMQQGLSAEQILASAASSSSVAADALARMKEAENSHDREVLEQMKVVYKDAQDRQDKNLEAMLKPVSEAAKHGPGDTIINQKS
jgi:hypothetical protein